MGKRKKVENLLRKYNMYKARVDILEEELKQVKDYENTKGIDYTSPAVSETYAIKSMVEETALSIVEVEAYLRRQLEGLKFEINRVDRVLKELNDLEKEVVVLFYIEGREWWYITDKVFLSKRQCQRLRDAAIDKLSLGLFGE